MKTVFEAIYARFLDSPALKAAVDGNLFPLEAPVGTPVPFIIADIESAEYERSLSYTFGQLIIELSIYDTDIGRGSDVANLAVAAFDRYVLPLSGYLDIGGLDVEFIQPMVYESTYHYVIQFRADIQKLY